MRVEIYDSPAGSSGGSAEGASEGRQPLTGPLCRTPRRRHKQRIFKNLRARRAHPHSKTKSQTFRGNSPANLNLTAPKNNNRGSAISHLQTKNYCLRNSLLKRAAHIFACHTQANQTPQNFHSRRKRTMALRGAQGDHPTEGREAPGAEDAQPS